MHANAVAADEPLEEGAAVHEARACVTSSFRKQSHKDKHHHHYLPCLFFPNKAPPDIQCKKKKSLSFTLQGSASFFFLAFLFFPHFFFPPPDQAVPDFALGQPCKPGAAPLAALPADAAASSALQQQNSSHVCRAIAGGLLKTARHWGRIGPVAFTSLKLWPRTGLDLLRKPLPMMSRSPRQRRLIGARNFCMGAVGHWAAQSSLQAARFLRPRHNSGLSSDCSLG